MSRIPNSAMPHAWAEDSPHAREVRRSRGEGGAQPSKALKIAAMAGLAYIGLRLLRGTLRHA